MAQRRKAPKQDAPQTIEQAVGQLAEYRDLIDKVEELKADAASSVAAILAARDEFMAPVKARADMLFRQLRVWWGVAAPELTDGKRKSVELAGCLIGERTTSPSFRHPGVEADALVEQLAELGLSELLSISTKIDKQACIRAIRANDELGQLLLWLGGRSHQSEEFFIDRVGRKDPAVETVDVTEEAAA